MAGQKYVTGGPLDYLGSIGSNTLTRNTLPFEIKRGEKPGSKHASGRDAKGGIVKNVRHKLQGREE